MAAVRVEDCVETPSSAADRHTSSPAPRYGRKGDSWVVRWLASSSSALPGQPVVAEAIPCGRSPTRCRRCSCSRRRRCRTHRQLCPRSSTRRVSGERIARTLINCFCDCSPANAPQSTGVDTSSTLACSLRKLSPRGPRDDDVNFDMSRVSTIYSRQAFSCNSLSVRLPSRDRVDQR